MKLTQEDIQFIDTYLENSDVVHIDIRMEMIDHVATAIEAEMRNGDEREFYYIFKDYMVENKRKLLDNHKTFLRETVNRFLKELFINLIKPICLVVVIGTFVLLTYLNTIYNFETVKSWASGSLLISFLLFATSYGIGIYTTKLKRMSSVERFGFTFVIIYQVFNFGYNMSNFITSEKHQIIMFVLLSIITALFVSMLMITLRVISESKKRYRKLA